MHPDLDKKARDVQWQQAKGHNVRAKVREFVVGDLVYAQNYGQGPKWLPGEIVEKHGSTLFTVQLKDGRKARKHTDQLMARATNAEIKIRIPGVPMTTMYWSTRTQTSPILMLNLLRALSLQSNPTQESKLLHLRMANLIPSSDDDIDENAERVERQFENTCGPRRSGRSRNPPDTYG